MEYRALPKFDQEFVSSKGSALEFNTLLFSRYWTGFDFSKPIRILDLGGVRSSTIDFFSDYPCFITVVNSIGELIYTGRDDESDLDTAEQINRIIPIDEQPYDLILVWDCFNYLPADIITILHYRLSLACHKNTRVYGFLYTSEKQNISPWDFQVHSHSKMSSQASTAETRQIRPLNSLKLMQYMPCFKLDRSVLIVNGMQEFLLTQN
ncbi:MAG: hypothetical protein OEY89_06795 [Gammaproteobacteria bacterium]|nr:hypothetical protein [Gammaproteobacteria bacterium]